MMQLSEIRILFFSTAILFVLIANGCSKVTTIGKKSHKFGEKAEQIIWLQVAGLTDEHLGLVKFDFPIEDSQTSLEKALCLGKLWSYNLYDLRVTPENGFMSQMTGSKNIKNSCEDYDRKLLWNHLEPFKFQAAILEGPATSKQSIFNLAECELGREKLAGTSVWLMRKQKKNENLPTFHYQKNELLRPGIFLDRSCQEKGCYAGLLNNAKVLWERMLVEPGQKVMIIRDFSFYESLKENKNIVEAKERLNEILEIYQYFLDLSRKNGKTLVLLSSSASLPFEYPDSGKQWNDFLKKGKNVIYRKTSLLSSIWADGPGSENFCTFMDESDVLERILWAPEKGVMGIFEF